MADFTSAMKNDPRVQVDMKWYDAISENESKWSQVSTTTLQPRRGHLIEAKAGQVVRVKQPTDHPNVVDLVLFNQQNPNEHQALGLTAQFEGLFIVQGSRIWSDFPHCRPMATCIQDTLDYSYLPEGYCNHFLFKACNTEVIESATGKIEQNSCHSNITEAIMPLGLAERGWEAAAVFNVIAYRPERDANGKMRCQGKNDVHTQSAKGDYIDFYAEMDLYVAADLCPMGDGSKLPGEAEIHPMDVEVYETGVTPVPFKQFHNWRKGFPLNTQDIGAR